MTEEDLGAIGRRLHKVPALARRYLENSSGLEDIARRHHEGRIFLCLGRRMDLGVCLQGTLELRETSYIPTWREAS